MAGARLTKQELDRLAFSQLSSRLSTQDCRKAWERAKGWFGNPELKEPVMVLAHGDSAIPDFRNIHTEVDRFLVEHLSSCGDMSPEEVLEGLFAHSIGHIKSFPRTLGTLVMLHNMADCFFGAKGQDFVDFVVQSYADMANDANNVQDDDMAEALLGLREAMCRSSTGALADLRHVMLACLHYYADSEYALRKDLAPYLERIQRVDFFSHDAHTMRLAMHGFGGIVKDMFEAEEPPILPEDMPHDCVLRHVLHNSTHAQIVEALHEIAPKLNRNEYITARKVMEEGSLIVPPQRPPLVIDTSEGMLAIGREVLGYYMNLSSAFRRRIEAERMAAAREREIACYGNGAHPPFSPRVNKKGSVRRPEANLLLVIDSSDTMQNPEAMKSPCVIGGICAARKYKEQGAKVGVLNFSGKSTYLPYTSELDGAAGAMVLYQGGGTVYDAGMFEILRRHWGFYHMKVGMMRGKRKTVTIDIPDDAYRAGETDVMILTDPQTVNLDATLSLLESQPSIRHVTLILLNASDEELGQMDRREWRKCTIIRPRHEVDIPYLLLAQAERNLELSDEGPKN